jgi:hypothetical protein
MQINAHNSSLSVRTDLRTEADTPSSVNNRYISVLGLQTDFLTHLHLAFVPDGSVAQEFVAFTFISQQQMSTSVNLLFFQLLGEYSWIPSCPQL